MDEELALSPMGICFGHLIDQSFIVVAVTLRCFDLKRDDAASDDRRGASFARDHALAVYCFLSLSVWRVLCCISAL